MGRLKYDPRLAPERLPSKIPPPAKGTPVGSNLGQGGAVGGPSMGKAYSRPWRPVKPANGGLPCPACGMGWPSEDEAAACCNPENAKRAEPQGGLLSAGQREEIRRHTRAGMGPKEIVRTMFLKPHQKNAAQAVYDTERLRLCQRLGLDVAGWHRWQEKKRGSVSWYRDSRK